MAIAAMSKLSIEDYETYLRERRRITPIVQEALDKAKKLRSEYGVIFYIAGGLTGMPDDVKVRYKELSRLINSQSNMFGYAPHLHGTDPVTHPSVSPEEVRDIDYLFAAVVPDYHLNCWYPIAHGNAVEAGWAELAEIPSIHLVPRSITLSRLVRGMHNIAATLTYDEFQADGLSQVRSFISNL
jgi:hypothetical protein